MNHGNMRWISKPIHLKENVGGILTYPLITHWRSMMSSQAAKRSRELFENGYYCAESVLLAVAEEKGIESDLIPKIATGFCSGIAQTSNQCGAVSGGILAINLLTGRSSPQDSIEKNYALIQEFLRTFEDRFGSTNCKALTGCDLNTEEGQLRFREDNKIVQCSEYVEEATQLVLDLL
jgi:C_GCAxxG_C_C family probable redox protein